MNIHYCLCLIALVCLCLGCEVLDHPSEAGDDRQVSASLQQYYTQINTYSENPVLAEELITKSVHAFLPAAASFITQEEKDVHAIHNKAQEILLGVKGTPAESTVGQIVGSRMLTWVIPNSVGASEELKLDYINVLNRNMSDEFLVIAQALDANEGDPMRIKQEAASALANLKAMKLAHSREIEQLEKFIEESGNPKLVEEAEEYLKNTQNDWPPRVERFASSGKTMLDVAHVQTLLEELVM